MRNWRLVRLGAFCLILALGLLLNASADIPLWGRVCAAGLMAAGVLHGFAWARGSEKDKR